MRSYYTPYQLKPCPKSDTSLPSLNPHRVDPAIIHPAESLLEKWSCDSKIR